MIACADSALMSKSLPAQPARYRSGGSARQALVGSAHALRTRRNRGALRNALLLAASLGFAALANGQAKPDPAWLAEPHLAISAWTADDAHRVGGVTETTNDFTAAERFEARAGGAATQFRTPGRAAFSQASANLSAERQLTFKVGDGLFKKLWVTAPASTRSSDGLGPLYNARACQRCHIKDGRGHPPEGPNDSRVSMLLSLSISREASGLAAERLNKLAAAPDPVYGGQLQDHAIAGINAEGRMEIAYEAFQVTLSGGETVSLRKPIYSVSNLGYGPMHPAVRLSPRVAPQMIGLGLIEAIRAQDIMALADPDDADGDGISGKANRVWSPAHGAWMLGRFGHKASSATILDQSAAAFAADMGLANRLHPAGSGDCTLKQPACLTAPDGGGPHDHNREVHDDALDLVVFYAGNLAVPNRRDVTSAEVLRGKQHFYETGCVACHHPKYVTHRLTDRPEHSFQLIWPYSDLLLHDMGEGLADGATAWNASGREWRTPPLWGIGLTATVSGHTNFLHDGRARSLLEAILWHGGEAANATATVINMAPRDRAALLAFLRSL